MKDEIKKSPVVSNVDEEKKNLDILSQKQQIEQEVEELYQSELGFTRIVELLINAKKPLIGHNMIYDVAFMFKQFLQELPINFVDFVNTWRANFPMLYDTKVLSVSTNFFGKTDL